MTAISGTILIGQRHFVTSFNRKPNGLRVLWQSSQVRTNSTDAHADGVAVKRFMSTIDAKVALSNEGSVEKQLSHTEVGPVPAGLAIVGIQPTGTLLPYTILYRKSDTYFSNCPKG